MKKIKILIDARIIGGEAQGSLTYLKGLYHALWAKHEEQYELYFAGHHLNAMQEQFPMIAPSHFILLPTQNRLDLLFRVYPKIIAEGNFDFAHFQYMTPFVKNCAFIVTTHDVLFNDFSEEFGWWYRVSRNYTFKKSLLKSEIRLTVSEYSQNSIAQHYGISAKSLAITPNAVAPNFFEDYDKDAAVNYIKKKFKIENYILYTSRIEPRKNHSLLLRAFCELELSKWGIHLVFIGNNTFPHPELEAQIKALQGQDKAQFHWLKNIDDQDLLACYRAARVFTYPSKAEGFGIPPLEAAACQIPTICSNSTAMQDFEFLNEWAFEPNDFAGFKQSLLDILHNPPSPIVLKNIAQQIQQKYNWENSADILHHAIENNNRKTMQPRDVKSVAVL